MKDDQIMSQVNYLGELRTRAIHLKSKQEMLTDAPVDNRGKGEAFSPTDTCATALATCALTTMGIRCRDLGLNLIGAEAQVKKIMAANPRRIAAIHIQLKIPGGQWSEADRVTVEHTARNCPVALSLHPNIDQKIGFTYF